MTLQNIFYGSPYLSHTSLEILRWVMVWAINWRLGNGIIITPCAV